MLLNIEDWKKEFSLKQKKDIISLLYKKLIIEKYHGYKKLFSNNAFKEDIPLYEHVLIINIMNCNFRLA